MSEFSAKVLEIHVFGATTPAGKSFVNQVKSTRPNWTIYQYSRHYSRAFDLSDPAAFVPSGDISAPSIWVNFAPIWLFAPFVNYLVSCSSDSISELVGIVSCSSSSAITKRFAFNSFDRELSSRLSTSEGQLLSVCRHLDIRCSLLQPSLVYGRVDAYHDNNLRRITQQLRRFPILFLPQNTGLRQPIHASQLAAAVASLADKMAQARLSPCLQHRILIGGDTTLTYHQMIKTLKYSFGSSDPASRCLLILIPNRLFFLIAALLLIRSPKAYEAVLRMSADLSGFTPVHQILGCEPQAFPVHPLA